MTTVKMRAALERLVAEREEAAYRRGVSDSEAERFPALIAGMIIGGAGGCAWMFILHLLK